MSPLALSMLYGLFALGAVAVYLAMPDGRRSARVAGLIFALAAIAAFAALAASRLIPGGWPSVAFGLLAGIAVLSAGKVIIHPRPVYSAVYFIVVVTAVAALLVLQEAEFLAIALIIVYAGAILVTYVFVIMLAQQSGASPVDLRPREPLAAVLVGFATMAAIAGQIGQLPAGRAPAGSTAEGLASSNTAGVGAELLSRYVVALEIAGVLLLVAMIGAIVMARKRVPLDVPVERGPAPGEIGRTVEPF